MPDFLLQLLGKSDATIPEGAEVDFVLRHAPRSWMVFLLIGVVAALLYGVYRFYRSENDSCPRGWKTFLSVLRCCVLLLAAFIFLGPALTYSIRKTIQPYVMVLLDDSLSMSIQDRYRDEKSVQSVASATGIAPGDLRENPPSRAEIIDRLLRRNDHELIRRLTTRGKIRVMTFSDRLRLRDTRGAQKPEEVLRDLEEDAEPVDVGDPVPPVNPEGKTTDIARAIRGARRLAAGHPLAGMVLISDGQNTAGGDPAAAASRAKENRLPIFTVGVGDPGEPVNLRIVDLWSPENVFQDDPLRLQVSIQTQGIESGSTVLELRTRRTGGTTVGEDPGEVVSRKTIRLQPGMQTVSFEHTPKTPGTRLYSVTTPVRPDELIDSDNSKSTPVNVLDQQVRILLVSGSPSWDYRMVKTLLTRDKTIDLSCWLQSMSADMQQEGNTPIDHLPRNRRELLEYDALLMFDPDPAEFNEAWIEEIKNFMENHAGGLLWMAGPQYSLDFLTRARTRDIRTVLPVRLRGIEAGIIEAVGTTKKREWPLKVPPAATDHPILQIRQDVQDLARIWESLPGIYWSFPARGPKPGSQVLLQHTNPRLRTEQGPVPLLATGQYGPGKSVYLGFQSTWRWRKPGLRYFQKFWIQTVRHLVQGRLVRGRTRGRLLTNRDLYAVGDRISVSARLYGADFAPLQQQSVSARLEAPGNPPREIELRPVPGRAGEYEGSVIARHRGLTELQVLLSDPDGEPVRVTRQFTVEMPNLESANPRMNRALLREIAARSGGRYFPLGEINQIADAIPDRRESTVVHGRPIPLWDTGRVLLLIVVLLTAVWAIRKKFRLL
jgi:hypothetical protein